MSTSISIARGSRVKQSDSDILRQAFGKVEDKYDGLTPEAVLRYAKPKRSEIHRFFEWDDSKAGHEHRLSQARQLICSVVVVYQTPAGSTITARAYQKLNRTKPEPYKRIEVIMESRDDTSALIRQAWNDLESWRRRYEHLLEFSKVFGLMDELKDSA